MTDNSERSQTPPTPENQSHRCTVRSWRRWYRLPILWLLHRGESPGVRCKTCGATWSWHR